MAEILNKIIYEENFKSSSIVVRTETAEWQKVVFSIKFSHRSRTLCIPCMIADGSCASNFVDNIH